MPYKPHTPQEHRERAVHLLRAYYAPGTDLDIEQNLLPALVAIAHAVLGLLEDDSLLEDGSA